jgi:cardiolipin synthase
MDSSATWTIPNILTIARISITPGFLIAFLNDAMGLAWFFFVLAGLTDALDGFLARALNQRSELGAMLDPLADKVLLVTSFLCLGAKGLVPNWLVVVVVTRDLVIVGGLFLLQFWGVDVRTRIAPTMISKLNTLVQILFVFVVLLHLTFPTWSMGGLRVLLEWIVVVCTTVSGVHYVVRGLKIFAESE